VGLVMVAVALLLGAAYFLATQVVNGPAIDDRNVAPTETAIAVEVAATSAAMPTRAPTTQAAVQPQTLPATAAPTAAATPIPAVAPAAAPTLAPTSPAIAPAGEPTSPPGAAAPVGTLGVPIPVSGPISIDDPAAGQAVMAAYLNYWKVSSDALFNLDPAPLDAVADGKTLIGLQQSVEQNRAAGRAIETNVKHDALVIRVQGDDAELVDNYADSSIYVDPTTKQPLPGQAAPASPDQAPVVSIKYQLHRFDGVWKVVGGTQYTCKGSAAPECAGQSG
jgi:hypothetical protein